MKSGIYMITNVVSGKRYIGSTTRLLRRLYEHKLKLKNGNHNNPHLQASYNKHGAAAFHTEILEYCSPELLEEREQYYIDLYKPEFNMRKPDRRYVPIKWQQAATTARSKPVRQIDPLTGEVIKVHVSAAQAGLSLGYSRNMVSAAIKMKRNRGGFKWEYIND